MNVALNYLKYQSSWKLVNHDGKNCKSGKLTKFGSQSSVFNFPFQIAIYHPVLSNKCNNIFLLC